MSELTCDELIEARDMLKGRDFDGGLASDLMRPYKEMNDGALLAKAAINGLLEPMGWGPFSEYLKQNPGAVMPGMPLTMFTQLIKDGVVFSVDAEMHE